MTLMHRVLDPVPCPSLAEHQAGGGGAGLHAALANGPDRTIGEIAAAGLRGRGGAGFPTWRKWRTVAENRSQRANTVVVVNAAEGEPGTFKDREILRRNPYRVLEGALVAAHAVGARTVIVGLKASFRTEIARVDEAMTELEQAGWCGDVELRIVRGPNSYLFGEETGLLEVIEGRRPFPRVTPPYRRGIDLDHGDLGHTAAQVHLAGAGGTDEPPALVNNVETFANVALVLGQGAPWFRSVGTSTAPGTVVCTITGDTIRHGVGEVATGTPLRDVIEAIGGGLPPGRRVGFVVPGVANALLPGDRIDTGVSYEALAAVGSGMGSAGFIVFDDDADPVAVAEGIARFLAVESCGQCEPCKRDGLDLALRLGRIRRAEATTRDVGSLLRSVDDVTRGARCFLASQQQRVVGSLLELFPDRIRTAEAPAARRAAPVLIAPLVDIVDGVAVLDEGHRRKQPDWSYDAVDSGATPAARLGNTPPDIPQPTRPLGARTDVRTAIAGDAPTPAAAFDQVRASHRRLSETLDDLLDHLDDAAASQEALDRLRRQLRLHVDATERVLHPMVRRVSGDPGDAAADAADHDERAALRLLDALKALGLQAEPDPSALREAAGHIRRHIIDEERALLPLLRDALDETQLRQLRDALAGSRLHSPWR
jgi:NADH:ubiquinone oxidoreductase subunit F (NADH-binding)